MSRSSTGWGIVKSCIALVLAWFIAAPLQAAAGDEAFESFFMHFVQDRIFGASRIQAPLTALLNPSQIPRPQEHWSAQEAVKKMTWPLPLAQLVGREQRIRIGTDRMAVAQYDPETGGYDFEYFFQLKGGLWYLVEYRDDRPG